jgi:hypothetical protein
MNTREALRTVQFGSDLLVNELGQDAWTRLLADARALWAVRVLDAKVRDLGGCNVYWSSNDDTCGIHNWEDHDGWHMHGQGEDAARLAAAEAVWGELPETERKRLLVRYVGCAVG